LTFQILNQLVKDRFFEKICFQVVIGSLNCYADNIKKLAKNYQNVVCLENVKKMSEVMKASDIAVSAGGSTLYEICAAQLPCVTFAFADNQYELIDVMQKKGVMRSAGKLKDGGLADKVTDCLKELIDNQKLREAFVKKEAELIDAKGVQRIAQALIEEISEK
ncbi:MAG: glycosyltransferase, partial [Christensenellaceae bacterium]